MTRFTAISDVHCHRLPKILKGFESDVLLIAGDITYRGTPIELRAFEEDLEAVKNWFPGGIVWIAGNHELGLEDNPHVGYEIAKRTGTHYLVDETVKVGGFTVFGSPWTPEFFNWAFNYKRPTKRWLRRPPADIVMTHGPCYGILDKTVRGEHVGCHELLASVTTQNPKPKVVIGGHVHESSGIEEFKGIKFFNASICNEAYKAVNDPWVFEL